MNDQPRADVLLPPLSEMAIPEDTFHRARTANLARWPTGAQVDLDEAVARHLALPPHKRLADAMRRAHRDRRCLTQPRANTPKPVWNPDIAQPIDFYAGWQEVPDNLAWDNAFKAEWELFLKHVAGEGDFRWNLLEGARGVQLAELAQRSWRERRWMDVPSLVV